MQTQILTYNIHGLPWSKCDYRAICDWIKHIQPVVVCLQEVFVESTRTFFKEHLERAGYSVCIPRDTNVAALTSGLLTAVLARECTIVSDCFYPFLDFHNVEWFANKGFHALRLRTRTGGLHIVNTHTQSDTEISWLFGRGVTDAIRKKQCDQMVRFLEASASPVLIIGDLNCEVSPHPYIRFLSPLNDDMHKATFYHTGENLDHIGWIPLQYAPAGCVFCDIVRRGPRLMACEIFQKPWSDHAPVLFTVLVPPLPTPKLDPK